MKHLLLTRFQGALIGGNLIYLDRQQIAPNQLIIDVSSAIATGVNSLIDRGKFEPLDWSQHVLADPVNPEQAIVAMLPLMLFFHDDRIRMREILVAVSHSWQLDWETCSSAVAIGYIISRSLTESLHPKTILSQLLDETIVLHPLILQELSTLDRLGDRPSSLHQVAQRFTANPHPMMTPTVLAIYCFLSTPEDFSLATRRAYQIDLSPLTCALTGILAGAHNSITGIPLNGYLATQERSQWLSLASNLLNTWAGVYQHGTTPLLTASTQPIVARPFAVASPQVIQRRN